MCVCVCLCRTYTHSIHIFKHLIYEALWILIHLEGNRLINILLVNYRNLLTTGRDPRNIYSSILPSYMCPPYIYVL